MIRILAALALLSPLAACHHGIHLGKDFGRSFTDTFAMQADLTRESIADFQYNLYGVEAQAIRVAVQEASTDAETAEAIQED